MEFNKSVFGIENMDEIVNISITKGFGVNSTSEGLTLQLSFSKTTFQKAFSCVIFTIGFFGVIGNLATIGKIVHDSKFHTPTFAAIGLLALADFLSVTVTIFGALTNVYQLFPDINVIIGSFTLNSYFHVCLLSVVLYLITVYPLQSRQHLNVTEVCWCSLTILVTSVIARAFISLATQKNILTIFIICNVIVLLFVFLIIVLLHVKKVRILQSSFSGTEQSQRRMNTVVMVIICIFVLFRLTDLVVDINFHIMFTSQQYSEEKIKILIRMGYICYLIRCLSFSCNPYILFLSHFI